MPCIKSFIKKNFSEGSANQCRKILDAYTGIALASSLKNDKTHIKNEIIYQIEQNEWTQIDFDMSPPVVVFSDNDGTTLIGFRYVNILKHQDPKFILKVLLILRRGGPTKV